MGVLLFRIAVFKVSFRGPQVVLEKDPRDHQEDRGFIILSFKSIYIVAVKQIVSHDGP